MLKNLAEFVKKTKGYDTVLMGSTWFEYFEIHQEGRVADVLLVRSAIPHLWCPLNTGLDEVPAIHVSGIGTYQDCPRKWHYKDSDWGLGYRTGETDKIAFGNWWHYAMALIASGYNYTEAYLLTEERILDMLEYSDDMYEIDLTADLLKLENLMKGHELWQASTANRYTDDKLEYLYVEHQFSEVVNGVRIQGQFDAIARHKDTGQYLIIERKTTQSPQRIIDGIQFDYQPRVYVLAAEKLLGHEVAGVIYEVVKNTDPYAVKMLKNGLPSKAQGELDGTTYQVYYDALCKAIKATGKDYDKVMEDYGEALHYLAKVSQSIYQRQFFAVTKAMRTITADHLVQLRQNMILDRFGPTEPPPNLNRYSCGFCQYKTICTAHDEGWGFDIPLSYSEGHRDDVPRFDEGLKELIHASTS